MQVESTADLSQIAFDANGLVPCVTQDWSTGEVLTLAYMNSEAVERTLETGEMHFWSRSRQELWHKGETSGNVQRMRALRVDCDADAILLRVEQVGGVACHEGYASCFFRRVDGKTEWHVVAARREAPSGS